ncbi:MAG: hypothetical protein GY711_13245 [bacterium]|nr:hypothetical protein [bacterium]
MRPETERGTQPTRPDPGGVRDVRSPHQGARTRALVALLADDSPATRAKVRAELARLRKAALPALRQAARSDESTTVRCRARQVLIDRDRQFSVRRIARYAARPSHDLESALFLLDAHRGPGSDMRPYKRALDAMGAELERRVAGLPPGGARVRELVQYMSQDIGFGGALDDYHHPDNIHLSRAIERRSGMPLTLSAIYAFVARRAGLPAGLLPFPGHVLLSVEQGAKRKIVDPFGHGRIVSRGACRKYLAQNGFPSRAEWYVVASDTAMFLRHILNLVKSCRSRGRGGDARQLEGVLSILADHPLQSLQVR